MERLSPPPPPPTRTIRLGFSKREETIPKVMSDFKVRICNFQKPRYFTVTILQALNKAI